MDEGVKLPLVPLNEGAPLSYARKMVATSIENQDEGPPLSYPRKVVAASMENEDKNEKHVHVPYIEKRKIKKSSPRMKHVEKFNKIINICLDLARVSAYDASGRIKSRNGKFVENSNVTLLLEHAMSPGKLLIGEQEFLEMLANANVNPDLILNENVKAKLKSLRTTYKTPNVEPEVFIRKVEHRPENFSRKRKLEEEEVEEDIPNKRLRNWIY